MPSRNRAREAAKAAAGDSSASPKKNGGKKTATKQAARKKAAKERGAKQKGTRRPAKGTAKRPRTGPMLDPSAAEDAETRFVQPHEATKSYICPGCNRDIPPGVGHLVAVPPDDPDLRRHWHRGCWRNRHTRF